jgi:hypothetical protein
LQVSILKGQCYIASILFLILFLLEEQKRELNKAVGKLDNIVVEILENFHDFVNIWREPEIKYVTQ